MRVKGKDRHWVDWLLMILACKGAGIVQSGHRRNYRGLSAHPNLSNYRRIEYRVITSQQTSQSFNSPQHPQV